MITSAGYPRRRLTAWLGVFAVLFQAWLPLVHHPATLFAPSGGETAAFDRLFGQTLVLCTAAGLVQEKILPGQHAPAHHVPVCPICQTLHVMGGFMPPGTASFAISSVLFFHHSIWPNAPGYIARIQLAGRPRAPPLPV